jgi:hypothetical protein
MGQGAVVGWFSLGLLLRHLASLPDQMVVGVVSSGNAIAWPGFG